MVVPGRLCYCSQDARVYMVVLPEFLLFLGLNGVMTGGRLPDISKDTE
jgi:hypothetical protein